MPMFMAELAFNIRIDRSFTVHYIPALLKVTAQFKGDGLAQLVFLNDRKFRIMKGEKVNLNK